MALPREVQAAWCECAGTCAGAAGLPGHSESCSDSMSPCSAALPSPSLACAGTHAPGSGEPRGREDRRGQSAADGGWGPLGVLGLTCSQGPSLLALDAVPSQGMHSPTARIRTLNAHCQGQEACFGGDLRVGPTGGRGCCSAGRVSRLPSVGLGGSLSEGRLAFLFQPSFPEEPLHSEEWAHLDPAEENMKSYRKLLLWGEARLPQPALPDGWETLTPSWGLPWDTGDVLNV